MLPVRIQLFEVTVNLISFERKNRINSAFPKRAHVGHLVVVKWKSQDHRFR